MENVIQQISGYSVAIPFTIAVIRFKLIHRDFHPFLLLLLFGLINESVSAYLYASEKTNSPAFNVFILLEALIVTHQFQKWNLVNNKKWALGVMIFFVAIWSTEVFLKGLDEFCSYFILVSSFAISVSSIIMINYRIIHESRSLARDPVFIISVCFLIYFAYSFLVECFLVNNTPDFNFLSRIQNIFSITNIFTNLLYTLAILWIPARQRFTLPY